MRVGEISIKKFQNPKLHKKTTDLQQCKPNYLVDKFSNYLIEEITSSFQ